MHPPLVVADASSCSLWFFRHQRSRPYLGPLHCHSFLNPPPTTLCLTLGIQLAHQPNSCSQTLKMFSADQAELHNITMLSRVHLIVQLTTCQPVQRGPDQRNVVDASDQRNNPLRGQQRASVLFNGCSSLLRKAGALAPRQRKPRSRHRPKGRETES